MIVHHRITQLLQKSRCPAVIFEKRTELNQVHSRGDGFMINGIIQFIFSIIATFSRAPPPNTPTATAAAAAQPPRNPFNHAARTCINASTSAQDFATCIIVVLVHRQRCLPPHPVSVGLEILKSGGNAIDAAIAMAFVLPICEPQSTGLYGDVFALIKPSNSDSIIGLNGSGKASVKNLTAENLRLKGYNKIPEDGVESITMPGAIACLRKFKSKIWLLDLNQFCNPAINYATNGIVVSPRVSFDWNYSLKNFKGKALRNLLG